MRRGGFALRRLRSRAGLVVALGLVASVVVAALVGTLVALEVGATSGVRATLAQLPPAEQVLQVQTRRADDPEAQADAAARVMDELLPADRRSWTTLRTPALATTVETGVVLAADPGAVDHVELEGALPDAAGEGTLHEEAAAVLGVVVGDVVTVVESAGATDVRIVGTWRPTDVEDPYWAGDSTVVDGLDPVADAVGPLLVTDATLAALDVTPFVRWTLAPSDDVGPDSLQRWAVGGPAVLQAMQDAGVGSRGMTSTGTLPQTAGALRDDLGAVRTTAMVPLTVVALVALVACWQLARLLADGRAAETRVLRSRGASPRHLAALSVPEVAIVLLGAGAGAAAVIVPTAGRAPGVVVGALLLAAACGTTLATIVAAVAAAATARAEAPESGRGGAAAVAGSALVMLVVLVAAIATWRLVRDPSTLSSGGVADPLALLAPAAALLAAALLAVVAVGPLTRALAALAARAPGLSPVIELRQISRRVSAVAVPIVLLVLAAATATLAAAHEGTWGDLRRVTAQVADGADVRVPLEDRPAGSPAPDLAATRALDGVTAATGVVRANVRSDAGRAPLTALPVAQASASSADVVLTPSALAALAPAGDPLPGLGASGAADLSVDLSAAAAVPQTFDGEELAASVLADLRERVEGQQWRAGVAVWLFDGTQQLRLELGEIVVPAEDAVRTTLTAPLPSGDWEMVALDVDILGAQVPVRWEIDVEELRAGSTPLLTDAAWAPLPLLGGPQDGRFARGTAPLSLAGVVGPRESWLSEDSRSVTQRVMPESDVPGVVPVLVTDPWAALIREDGTDVSLGGTPLRLVQAGRTAAVPGDLRSGALLADLPTLQAAVLRAGGSPPSLSEIWLSVEQDPAAAGERAAALAGSDTVLLADVDADDGGAVAAPAHLAMRVSAVCAILLATTALMAFVLAELRARRGEVVALRAVGVGADGQGRSRAGELGVVGAAAALVGVAAGWLVSRAVVVALVRGTGPIGSAPLPLGLSIDLPLAAVLLGATVGGLLSVLVCYAALTRAQARDTGWREAER